MAEQRELNRQERVYRAAHLFECFNWPRAKQECLNESIPDEEITEGAALAEERRDRRYLERGISGDPAWGGGRWI